MTMFKGLFLSIVLTTVGMLGLPYLLLQLM